MKEWFKKQNKRKLVLRIMILFCALAATKLTLRFIINEVICWDFNNEVYNTKLVKSLYVLNFSERYIAYYNEGDILYKKDDFPAAIDRFQKALDRKPPKARVCDVRVNLSLSMVRNIDPNSNKDVRYNALEEAKQVLYEDDCAHADDNNGQSAEAEKLEEEIKNLQNPPQSSGNGDGDGDNGNGDSNDQNQNGQGDNQNQDNQDGQGDDQNQDQNQDQNGENEQERQLEEELQNRNQDAQRNRNQEMDGYSDRNGGGGSYYDGKKW